MEAVVYNINGQDTGRRVMLEDSVFGITPNDHCIYLDVKQFMANNRQGTHETKGRSQMSGSTRKLKKQKGTGTARCGGIKSPLFRGGGRMFGPHPHDYNFKLNRKVKRLARKSALAYKAKENKILVVEDFNFKAPKTKEFVELRKNLKILDKKSLLVLTIPNKNVYLSSRNLPYSEVVTIGELNTYNILKTNILVLTESSVPKINETLKS